MYRSTDMYRTTSTNWTPFLFVVLAGFLTLGIVLGASELFNQATAAARAREQDARTAAILAGNQYQQQRYAMELQALQARRDQELIQMQQDHVLWTELKEVVTLALAGVVAAAIIVLGGAGAFWIACQGLVRLRMRPKRAGPVRQPAGRVFRFSNHLERRKVASWSAPKTRRVARQ